MTFSNQQRRAAQMGRANRQQCAMRLVNQVPSSGLRHMCQIFAEAYFSLYPVPELLNKWNIKYCRHRFENLYADWAEGCYAYTQTNSRSNGVYLRPQLEEDECRYMLIQVILHEMCHSHLDTTKKVPVGEDQHGKTFQKLASIVSKRAGIPIPLHFDKHNVPYFPGKIANPKRK